MNASLCVYISISQWNNNNNNRRRVASIEPHPMILTLCPILQHPENAAQHKFNKLTLILSVMSDVAQCHVTINCTLNETVYSGVCILCNWHTIRRRSMWYFIYLFLLAYFCVLLFCFICNTATIRCIVYFIWLYQLYKIVCSSLSIHLNALASDKSHAKKTKMLKCRGKQVWKDVQMTLIRSILSFSIWYLLRQTHEQ